MKTKDEILNELPNFYGTTHYVRWSVLFNNFLLTEGAHYVAEACGAYWLMDLFASHFKAYRNEGFAVLRLKVSEYNKAEVLIEDGNDGVLAKQDIEYTDFPLDSLVLYAVPQDNMWIILLPGEY